MNSEIASRARDFSSIVSTKWFFSPKPQLEDIIRAIIVGKSQKLM